MGTCGIDKCFIYVTETHTFTLMTKARVFFKTHDMWLVNNSEYLMNNLMYVYLYNTSSAL